MKQMRSLVVGSGRWVAVLSALSAVTALSLDMSLPAQPALADRFGVPAETAGMTLTAFLVAFAFAQLLVGPLSDAHGRKPVLMTGLTLFTLGGIGCAFAPSIALLIVFRMVQGLGAAAAPVLARAMVRDSHPDDSARILSTMLAGLALAPMLAPAIGGVVLAWSWRWIFAILAVCGALLALLANRLAETHPIHARTRTSVLRGPLTVLRMPGIRLPMFVSCATFTGQFTFVSVSSFILIDGFGVSPTRFALYFCACALAILTSSLLGRAMLRAGRHPRNVMRVGVTFLATGGLCSFLANRADLGIPGFLIPVVIYFFGVGLAAPSSTALAMQPVPQLAGTASATIGSIQMAVGACVGYLVERYGGTDPALFSSVFAIVGVSAFVVGNVAGVRRQT